MKSSLGMLRKFALHKNDAKEKRDNQPSALLDELVQASKVRLSIKYRRFVSMSCLNCLLSSLQIRLW